MLLLYLYWKICLNFADVGRSHYRKVVLSFEGFMELTARTYY